MCPWGFQGAEAPRFQDNWHLEVVRLSAPRAGRLYLTGNIPGTHFCYGLSRHQAQSEAGRIMSIKNPKDTVGIQTRDLPVCSAVPNQNAIPRTPPTNIQRCRYKRNATCGP